MSQDRYDIWKMGHTPIKIDTLGQHLSSYPNIEDRDILYNGFRYGFRLNYHGPRIPFDSKNLKSVLTDPDRAREKIETEILSGRIAGPFDYRPISNLRCSPIGLVPKKTGGLRLITHLSYPPLHSVNDFIDESFTSVKYSSFDNAIAIVQKLGKGAKLAKMDIKSAFRLLPVFPGDFDLLGFKIEDKFYIDKCMPMGCSISCSSFEKFSTFLHWVLENKSGSKNIDHYLDDFLFGGKEGSDECENLMFQYKTICEDIGVPLANEKTEGPTTLIDYLGLTIDTVKMLIKIPDKKVKELLEKITRLASMKKVTLKELQSICGSLAFCTKALPAGRAFSCRLYMATTRASKPFHFIRVTLGMKKDLLMWKLFLEKFNGVSYIHDVEWTSNFDLDLYTDSAGGIGKGCAAYLNGQWAYLPWPVEWDGSEIMKDMTYLEIIPIALAIFLWFDKFHLKNILFHSDNSAVVTILNKKSTKSERVMSILRLIVYCSLIGNFQFKAVHIFSKYNSVADALSRANFQKFRCLAPLADHSPTPIPVEFWNLLRMK